MMLQDSDEIRLLRDVDIVEVNGIEEYVKFLPVTVLRKHILICSDKQCFYHFYAVCFLILCICKTAYPYSQILAVKKLTKMFVPCI